MGRAPLRSIASLYDATALNGIWILGEADSPNPPISAIGETPSSQVRVLVHQSVSGTQIEFHESGVMQFVVETGQRPFETLENLHALRLRRGQRRCDREPMAVTPLRCDARIDHQAVLEGMVADSICRSKVLGQHRLRRAIAHHFDGPVEPGAAYIADVVETVGQPPQSRLELEGALLRVGQ